MLANDYGKSYLLNVLTNPTDGTPAQIISYSSSVWEPNALRIEFDIVQQPTWIQTAEISIWNLNLSTEVQAITQGCGIQLYGGYQQNTGLLFQGYIYQVLYTKEHGTDYRTTFRCVRGNNLVQNFVRTASAAGTTQAQFLAQIATACRSPFTSNVVTGALTGKRYPRAKVAFGSVSHYFEQIARDNGLQHFGDGQTASIGPLTGSGVPDFIYAPPIPLGSSATPNVGTNYTLVGTPDQTVEGVDFRVLLDPRLVFRNNPPLQVKLDMSLINPLPIEQGQVLAPFEASAVYCVGGVRHIGDSRGNEWHTEVTGVVPNYYARIISQMQTGSP